MAFDPATLTLHELLTRAHRITGGSVHGALDYLKALGGVTPAARSAFAALLQFRDRQPAATAFTVDRFGRLHADCDKPGIENMNRVPAWARRVS
jgi:hypothetical protein